MLLAMRLNFLKILYILYFEFIMYESDPCIGYSCHNLAVNPRIYCRMRLINFDCTILTLGAYDTRVMKPLYPEVLGQCSYDTRAGMWRTRGQEHLACVEVFASLPVQLERS